MFGLLEADGKALACNQPKGGHTDALTPTSASHPKADPASIGLGPCKPTGSYVGSCPKSGPADNDPTADIRRSK
jgi:hypothetical protein